MTQSCSWLTVIGATTRKELLIWMRQWKVIAASRANIVLVGSDQGSQPDVGLFPYAQAKAALHSLTKLLAREYGPAIRVNAVAPGMSRTALVEGLMERLARDEFHMDRATAEQLELRRRGVPIARLGEPEEMADAVLFLAQNAFCTGSILDLSGGNIRGV